MRARLKVYEYIECFMNMRKSVLFLAALLVSLASYSQNFQDRWTIGGKGELAWNIDGRVPHSDFIEMSGQMVSTVVRYEVAADSSLNISAPGRLCSQATSASSSARLPWCADLLR